MKWTNWIGKTIHRLKLVFDTPVPAPAPVEEQVLSPAPAVKNLPKKTAAPRRGRPVSASLEKAVELVARNPQTTPAELAQKLSVSRDYGRTLLRRARARIEQDGRAAAAAIQPVKKRPTAVPALPASATEPKSEPESFPSLSIPFPRSINLNRRVQVLRLAAQGQTMQSIAMEVGIPTGEVEFVLKMDRLLREAI
jgi:hypothetical protein